MRPVVVTCTAPTIDYSRFREPLITPPPAGWTAPTAPRHQASGVRELIATLDSIRTAPCGAQPEGSR